MGTCSSFFGRGLQVFGLPAQDFGNSLGTQIGIFGDPGQIQSPLADRVGNRLCPFRRFVRRQGQFAGLPAQGFVDLVQAAFRSVRRKSQTPQVPAQSRRFMSHHAAPLEESDNHPQQGQRRQQTSGHAAQFMGKKSAEVAPLQLFADKGNSNRQPDGAQHQTGNGQQAVFQVKGRRPLVVEKAFLIRNLRGGLTPRLDIVRSQSAVKTGFQGIAVVDTLLRIFFNHSPSLVSSAWC